MQEPVKYVPVLSVSAAPDTQYIPAPVAWDPKLPLESNPSIIAWQSPHDPHGALGPVPV